MASLLLLQPPLAGPPSLASRHQLRRRQVDDGRGSLWSRRPNGVVHVGQLGVIMRSVSSSGSEASRLIGEMRSARTRCRSSLGSPPGKMQNTSTQSSSSWRSEPSTSLPALIAYADVAPRPRGRMPGGSDVRCRANSDGRPEFSQEAKMREEVISPFRTVRMFFYLAFMASAGVGGLIALTRVVGALAGAPAAPPLNETLLDLGVDVGAIALFAVLYRSDARAKGAQLARLTREESLGKLRLELSSGRLITVGQLRGTSRLLVVAGPLDHVREALARAEPYKAALLERGITVVPFVTGGPGSSPASGSSGGASGAAALLPGDFVGFVSALKLPEGGNSATGGAAAAAAAGAEEGGPEGTGSTQEASGLITADMEARWLTRPAYTDEWSKWLQDQLKFANVQPGAPVYISLRLDGRVRGSGVGYPPWQVIAAQLPPMKGMWQGPLDGMDGRVF